VAKDTRIDIQVELFLVPGVFTVVMVLPKIATTGDGDTTIVTWSNTGLLDASTNGSYAFTDYGETPDGYSGAYSGLMIHPDLPRRIYVSVLP